MHPAIRLYAVHNKQTLKLLALNRLEYCYCTGDLLKTLFVVYVLVEVCWFIRVLSLENFKRDKFFISLNAIYVYIRMCVKCTSCGIMWTSYIKHHKSIILYFLFQYGGINDHLHGWNWAPKYYISIKVKTNFSVWVMNYSFFFVLFYSRLSTIVS